ncbi:MAG: fimbrial protein [Achromobacter sp.]
MKNRITAAAAAVLALAAANVMAGPGDSVGGGNIEFKGNVNADTCYVQSSGGDAKSIVVPMGTVNTADVANSSLASPVMPQGVNQSGTDFQITCSAKAGVEMRFAAAANQLESGNKILKINGGVSGSTLANGVGIAVYPDRSNATATTAFDLSNGVLYTGDLEAGDKVRVHFAAAYVKTSGALKAGVADATLPFTIITP